MTNVLLPRTNCIANAFSESQGWWHLRRWFQARKDWRKRWNDRSGSSDNTPSDRDKPAERSAVNEREFLGTNRIRIVFSLSTISIRKTEDQISSPRWLITSKNAFSYPKIDPGELIDFQEHLSMRRLTFAEVLHSHWHWFDPRELQVDFSSVLVCAPNRSGSVTDVISA